MPLRLRATTVTHRASTDSSAAPGDSLCGYRIVRRLGDGARAEVYLGFAESAIENESSDTAVIKICRMASRATATTELECLARADHPHVVSLLDAATTPSGIPCLVLERLARGSLAHLLEKRDVLTRGEAVTILAPIASAVDTLHTNGVIHGAIGAGAVLFRSSGAPVLARFGHASLIEPGLSSALLAPLVAADCASLAELAALVLERVNAADAADAAGIAEWARTHAGMDDFGHSLSMRLFDFAEPSVVAFEAIEAVASHVPARITGAADGVGVGDPRSSLGSRMRELLPDDIMTRGIAVVRSLRSVRTPVWVAAASVLVAIIAAVVLVPSGTDAASSRAVTASPRPATSGAVSTRPATPAPETTVDDPVAGLQALLAARQRCMHDLSVLCLDGVDQDGSAALQDDADVIRGVREGGEVEESSRLQDAAPHVVERLGDSVLVDLGGDGKPASVLMIRTEAGWRIRDYLD